MEANSKPNSTKLRLIVELWKDSRKPNRALKDLEKLIKKEGDHPSLHIIRAGLLHDCQRFGESKAALAKFLQSEGPVKDVQLLEEAQGLVAQLQVRDGEMSTSAGKDLGKLWSLAVTQADSKNAVIDQWFRSAMRCGHWSDAQRAATFWKKTRPQSSRYFLLHAALCQVLANNVASTEPDIARLNSTLAWRLVNAAVPKSQSQPGDKTSIKTWQDFMVLHRIYQDQERHGEMLALLESGIFDTLIKTSWTNQEEVAARMNMLRSLTRWEPLLDLSLTQLSACLEGGSVSPQTRREGLDWSVPESALLAMEHLGPSAIGKVVGILEAVCRTSWATDRSVALAVVKLFDHASPEALEACRQPDHQLPKTQFDACLGYYKTAGTKPCCFRDLVGVFERMPGATMLGFARKVSEVSLLARPDGDEKSTTKISKWLQLEVCAIMFSYRALTLSDDLEPTTPPTTPFSSLLERIYGVLDVAQRASVELPKDLAPLATEVLLRIDTLGWQSEGLSHAHRHTHAIQALCLLHKFHELDPRDFQVKMLQLRIYARLGLAVLMPHQYHELGIKGALVESISHEMFTRASGFAAFSVRFPPIGRTTLRSTDPEADFMSKMKHALSTLEEWMADLSPSAVDPERPVHGMIGSMAEMRNKIRGSFTWRMLIVEQRRVARMRGNERDLASIASIGIWLKDCSDQRSWDYPPQIGAGEILGNIHLGPKPGLYWLSTRMLNDHAVNLLTNAFTFCDFDLQKARETVSGTGNEGLSSVTELSEAELTMEPAWIILRDLAAEVSRAPKPATITPRNRDLCRQLRQSLDKITEVRSSRRTDRADELLPGTEGLQAVFLTFELLKACSILCNRQGAAPLVAKDDSSALLASLQACWKATVGGVEDWKRSLSSSECRERLLALVLAGNEGQALGKYAGEEEVGKVVDFVVQCAMPSIESVVAQSPV